MTGYVVRRLLWAVFVVWAVSAAVFFVTFATGDPVALVIPPDVSRQDYEVLHHALGFDKPVWQQYLDFLGGALRGDLGTSLRYRQPVAPMVLERLPATFELAGAALLFATACAIPLGVISAVRRGSLVDQAAMALALLGQCVPTFWLGIMLILLFAVQLRLVPAFGNAGASSLILPAITLGAYSMARTARMTRSNMLEVLSSDYVRTARAKGLSEFSTIAIHALKNAAVPIATMLGLEAGILLSGAVITETVFAYPGVGLLAVQAVENRDVRVVQGAVLVVATFFVAINFLLDLLYLALDPRVRLWSRS